MELVYREIQALRREVRGWNERMVPGGRVELPTPAFSGPRSTGELPRHRGSERFYGGGDGGSIKESISVWPVAGSTAIPARESFMEMETSRDASVSPADFLDFVIPKPAGKMLAPQRSA